MHLHVQRNVHSVAHDKSLDQTQQVVFFHATVLIWDPLDEVDHLMGGSWELSKSDCMVMIVLEDEVSYSDVVQLGDWLVTSVNWERGGSGSFSCLPRLRLLCKLWKGLTSTSWRPFGLFGLLKRAMHSTPGNVCMHNVYACLQVAVGLDCASSHCPHCDVTMY